MEDAGSEWLRGHERLLVVVFLPRRARMHSREWPSAERTAAVEETMEYC